MLMNIYAVTAEDSDAVITFVECSLHPASVYLVFELSTEANENKPRYWIVIIKFCLHNNLILLLIFVFFMLFWVFY